MDMKSGGTIRMRIPLRSAGMKRAVDAAACV